MRHAPALHLRWPAPPDEREVERLLAWVDDDGPVGVDGEGAERRVFFETADTRRRAAERLAQLAPTLGVSAIDVPDEDWAERSQAALGPVAVGRLVVTPPWHAGAPVEGDRIEIVIRPSTGFGTGHHASTRLCLRLLQAVPLAGRAVLDVGTGSGVLALAAWHLGGRPVVGLEPDPDALVAARENQALNGATGAIDLRQAAFATVAGATYDVIAANLTGALLAADADRFAARARPGAHLVAAGFEAGEKDAVAGALVVSGWQVVAEAFEEGWTGLTLRRLTTPTASRGR